MPMISEHVKMLILFGSFCNDHYCLFLVIIEKHAPHSRYFSDELGDLNEKLNSGHGSPL